MRISKAKAKVDWAAIDAMTDEDIERQIADNPDTLDTSEIPAHKWKIVTPLDVSAIREKVGLTQAEFSRAFDIPLGTLRHWEQGKREPRGPARALLNIINAETQAVLRVLAEQNKELEA